MSTQPSWTDIAQALSAAAVAAFTAILTWVAIVQARLLKRSTLLSENALAASQQSASAAIKAAELAEANLVSVQRARVHFDRPFTLYMTNVPTDDHVLGRVQVQWINSGPTAPVDLRFGVALRYDLPPLEEGFSPFYEPTLGPAFVGPGATVKSGELDISRGQFERLKRGEALIHISGVAVYRDGFAGTPERRSTVCLRLEPGIPEQGKGEVAFSFTQLGEFTSAS